MGVIEQLHPLQLTGACLMSDRLQFRYRLDGRHQDMPGRITAARLIGPGVDLALTEVAPGVLQAPVPGVAGRLTLAVDAVEGCTNGVPSLPWRVDVLLPAEALADYLAAEPIQATAELTEGVVVRVGRLLRCRRSVVLFWDGVVAGSEMSLSGDIRGEVLAGSDPLIHTTYRYPPLGGQRKLRPAPEGTAASTMQIEVQAVEYGAYTTDSPLLWQINRARLEAPGAWRLGLSVPAERPVALAPDLVAGTDWIKMTLEEVWLARSQTVLRFVGAAGALGLNNGLSLEDESGRRYAWTGGSSQDGCMECYFQPVPPTARRLFLAGEGGGLQVHGPVEIPLEPGARGRRVCGGPGHTFAGSASEDGMTPSSGIVVEIPDVSPQDEPEAHVAGKQPPPCTPQLRAWLAEQSVPALRMRFEPAERESLSPMESHIGGQPYWPANEAWPVCGHCDRPLTFIGQVRLDGLGAPRVGKAQLLTLHYCLECIPDGPEQASAYRLRLYQHLGGSPLETCLPERMADPGYTPCRLVLVPVQSVPDWHDATFPVRGLGLGDNRYATYDAEAKALTAAPNRESRLGGYPDWICVPGWPDCAECGERMQLIWQLDSEREAGLVWGYSGRVYICVCPDCANEQSLALVMQCCS